MQERLIQEVRRREHVSRGSIPTEDSVLRLIGALLAEFHEAWLGQKVSTWLTHETQRKAAKAKKNVVAMLKRNLDRNEFTRNLWT